MNGFTKVLRKSIRFKEIEFMEHVKDILIKPPK